jgi:hypothetical protein
VDYAMIRQSAGGLGEKRKPGNPFEKPDPICACQPRDAIANRTFALTARRRAATALAADRVSADRGACT